MPSFSGGQTAALPFDLPFNHGLLGSSSDAHGYKMQRTIGRYCSEINSRRAFGQRVVFHRRPAASRPSSSCKWTLKRPVNHKKYRRRRCDKKRRSKLVADRLQQERKANCRLSIAKSSVKHSRQATKEINISERWRRREPGGAVNRRAPGKKKNCQPSAAS